MPHPVHPVSVQINRIHSGAVCEEIGARLSVALGSPSNELSPCQVELIKQLAKADCGDEPSKTKRDFSA